MAPVWIIENGSFSEVCSEVLLEGETHPLIGASFINFSYNLTGWFERIENLHTIVETWTWVAQTTLWRSGLVPASYSFWPWMCPLWCPPQSNEGQGISPLDSQYHRLHYFIFSQWSNWAFVFAMFRHQKIQRWISHGPWAQGSIGKREKCINRWFTCIVNVHARCCQSIKKRGGQSQIETIGYSFLKMTYKLILEVTSDCLFELCMLFLLFHKIWWIWERALLDHSFSGTNTN